MTLPYR